MESFSMIDTVVKELEKDADLIRIKKVIYFACEGIWENDETKLEEINLKELIEELYNKTGNLETLDRRLSRIVSKVNKKTEYSLLAQKIIRSVGKLYPEEEEEEDMTVMESSPNLNIVGSDDQSIFKEKLVAEESYLRDPGKLFDAREKIMQGTNPLKAKILIFSTVEHKFNFSERDWLLLKAKNLDGLLRQIFNLCLSITDLESSLYRTANNFEDPDEYTQVASVIINALTASYSEENIVLEREAEVDKSEASTSEIKRTDIDSNNYFYKGGISLVGQKESEITNEENEEQSINSLAGIINQTEEKNLADLINDSQTVSAIPTEPKIVTQGQYKKASLGEKNILDSIKQKLEIDNEVSALVNQKVDAVMDAMEAQFISLEESLNDLLQGEPEEKRLSLKYTALGDLISNIQDKSTKFREILRQLETEERKTLNLNNYSNTINQELEQDKEIYDENQQDIIELATQGNPKAVAIIINQSLQQQGIKVIAGRKNNYLHIVLESEQVPNQEIVTPVVQEKIASLKSEHLKNVKIHGRQLGSKSIIWTQTISF
ncbi:MAG: hypothetical protein F6K40_24815 [Okeania sp. SIO3I5]|uniref:hypothetical protein n=1 Tax=Okeania sp. SIO3I5 TaxID=2607805 RepID=UPI0013B81C26|nr:hypothetical protein [Okeania sp. SIO3I5]NEQ39298.1 hypothetical protein [Okeania sp. SIO3I5]